MAATFVKCTELRSTSRIASGSVSSTAGNALIAVVCEYAPSTGTLTMSGGGSWTTDYSPSELNTMKVATGSCLSATGGAQTITATFSSGSGTTVFVLEFSGMAASSMFETNGTAASGTSTTPTTNSVTNTQADSVKVAGASVDAGNNAAWSSTGTGWSLPTNGSEPDGLNWLIGACGYKIVSASQSDTESWSRSGSNPWHAGITTYKAAASTGLPPGLGPSGEMEMSTQATMAAMMR